MRISIILLCYLFFHSCAVIQSPSGGVKDTISPFIYYAEPSNYQRNFKNNEINFYFNKYMNRSKVIESININPPCKFDYNWTRKNLTIQLEDSLKDNITYSIQFGADIVDYWGISADQSYTYVFSTGEIIDTLKIRGKLNDKNPANKIVHCYDISSSTFDYLKPDYVTNLGNNGFFEFNALKDQAYRIIIFDDKNKDSKITLGFEDYSLYHQDLIASDNPSTLNFQLNLIEDNLPPRLDKINVFNDYIIKLSFSEKVKFTDSSFVISDSLLNKLDIIKSTFYDNFDSLNVILITEKLDSIQKYKINYFVTDSTGNSSIDSIAKKDFNLPKRIIKQDLVYDIIGLKDSSAISHDDNVYISFSEGQSNFYEENIELIELKDSSKKLFRLSKISDKYLKLNFNNLAPDRSYLVKINFKQIKSVLGNEYKDSIIIKSFNIAPKKQLSNVNGTLKMDSLNYENPILIMYNDKFYKEFQVLDNKWYFENIGSGKYYFKLYDDQNRNDIYDKGSIEPFYHSEKIYFLKNEIEVKEKWDLEKVVLAY